MYPKLRRFIYSLLHILILLLVVSVSATAQSDLLRSPDLSEVAVENYSDSQILEFLHQARAAGYTEGKLFSTLSARGLPSSEIEKLRMRISELQSDTTKPSGKFANVATSDRFDSSLGKVPVNYIKTDTSIFGSELFNSSTLAFEPNLRIPAPPNYMLGPDDELIVSVYGYSEKKYELRINELGEIYIPNVGPLLVNGLTLEEAADRIKNKLANTIYRAIKTGQTKVQVTLGKIRSIRVTVIGQAKKPGNYTVSSLTTLYNILYLCGGPSDMGSFRAIEVIRGTEKRLADLYDFLVYGNQKDNILLKEGDVIRIPYYKNRVILTGSVKRQGKFEMLDNETFSNLLSYAGGFTDIAYKGAVTVERVTDSVRKIIDLEARNFNSFQTKGSDRYIVGRLNDEFSNRIYVTGSVQRPGPYQLTEGLTVSSLVQKAGGFTSDASRSQVLLYRYLPNRLPEITTLNLDSISEAGKTVLLRKNDSLVVQSIFFFHDKNYITIDGKVRMPGRYQWRRNITLEEVLLESGGIVESGDSSSIEISRRIQDAAVRQKNHKESEIIQINLKDPTYKNISLEPFDIIVIKTKPGYSVQRTILIQGEILSPGKYALKNSVTRVSDVIARTGGFKASADSTALMIQRIDNPAYSIQERKNLFEKILNISQDSIDRNPNLLSELYQKYEVINIDLDEALDNPTGPQNLPLEDGDILTINRRSNLVRVSGEVFFPSTVPYIPNKNLKYYVEQAGDFTPQSRKTSAMVIQPNGKVRSVKHFLFFKSYPAVDPGSEILVPKKTPRNKERISIGELSVVLSSLALVANVIFNISK